MLQNDCPLHIKDPLYFKITTYFIDIITIESLADIFYIIILFSKDGTYIYSR